MIRTKSKIIADFFKVFFFEVFVHYIDVKLHFTVKEYEQIFIFVIMFYNLISSFKVLVVKSLTKVYQVLAWYTDFFEILYIFNLIFERLQLLTIPRLPNFFQRLNNWVYIWIYMIKHFISEAFI